MGLAQSQRPLLTLLTVWMLVLLLFSPALAMTTGSHNKCYKNQVKACANANISLVFTAPATQEKMESTINTMLEINKLKCAPFLDILVCSIQLKACFTKVDHHVPPCHDFCTDLQQMCAPMLAILGRKWPNSLDCSQLPKHSDKSTMCIRPPPKDFNATKKKFQSERESVMKKLESFKEQMPSRWGDQHQSTKVMYTPKPDTCTSAQVKLGHGVQTVCMKRCNASFLFSSDDKQFAETWMLIWSVICMTCTGLAIITFAIDSNRFVFPERPMVWVAASFFLFSSGHLLRIGFGPNLSCSESESPIATTGDSYLISRHAGNWCAVNFLILYFSSIAGSMWWLLLTITFYLCAAKKWTHHAFQKKAMWLHFFAWGVPLLLSVVVIVLHRVEGDELTHLCQVDGSDENNYLMFIIIPITLILVAGTLFLICSISSTFTVCSRLKESGNLEYRKAMKLMTKITMFSVLFVLPSVCVIAINVYEYLNRESWDESVGSVLKNTHCSSIDGIRPISGCSLENAPISAIFMLKIFMSLAAGLSSGLIVWFNCKSANTWYRCCCRQVLRRRSKPSTMATPAYSIVDSNIRMGNTLPANFLESSHSKYPPMPGIGMAEV